MASIPLPALDLKPMPQPDTLGNFSKLLEIRQQQAMAPLQQQQAQQQVQSGALDLQQKQLQMKAQQTLQAIGPNHITRDDKGRPTGYDYDGLMNDATSKGIPPAMLAPIQEMHKKAVDTVLAQTNADKGRIENQFSINKQAYEQMEGIKALTDPAQRQQAWQEFGQWAQKNGMDTSQAPPQAPDNDTLTAREAVLGMHGQALADAKNQAEQFKAQQQGDEAKANAEKVQQQNAFAKKYNLPAGVPVDMMEMADYLDKNPGKGPKDYAAWKASIAPSVKFKLETNAAGGGGTPGQPTNWDTTAKNLGMTKEALTQAAEKYFTTGQLPSQGRGISGPATNKAIMNLASELHPGASLSANSAEYKANSESLKKLQTQFDAVSAFESTANKNIEVLKSTLGGIPDLGARFANIPARQINSAMLGTEGMAKFKTALATVQNESAKILNSANAGGVLSDSARHELQDIVDGNATIPAMLGSLGILQKDFGNRHQSYQDQITDIKGRLGTQPQNNGAQPTSSAAPASGGFNWDAHPMVK